MTLSPVTVQTTPESLPSTPNWMGEVAAVAQLLSQTSILKAIEERVRFARARMGTYDLIDFVVVLIGYALPGEPTLRAFYDRLWPFADPFMALFGRTFTFPLGTLALPCGSRSGKCGEPAHPVSGGSLRSHAVC